MESKPFALIGINSDPKERLKQVIKKENMTWRSWWDGGITGGPIATKWNVNSWPTIYVLDQNGVIRYRDRREKELDEAVDTLLSEMEKSKK